jgi:hypothetical protein
VRFAGGWLFDRVMAGWDVAVHVAEPADTRALQILGARVVDLDQTLAAYGPFPDALAVDADLYRTDHRVRDLVDAAAGESSTDVRLWGDGCPSGMDGSLCHRLSVAARAFKAQALAAAATPVDAIDEAELFLAELTALQLVR